MDLDPEALIATESTLRSLVRQVEELFRAVDRLETIREEITKAGQSINEVYGALRHQKPPPPREAVQGRIRPHERRIKELQREQGTLKHKLGRTEDELYKAICTGARTVPPLGPLADEFPVVWGARHSPERQVRLLRDFLLRALEILRPEIDRSFQTALPPVEPATVNPKLVRHLRRARLYQQLASELATVQGRLRESTTLGELRKAYPDWQLWQILSLDEQKELLEEKFRPRAYAKELTRRAEGLSSVESVLRSLKIVGRVTRGQSHR